MFFLSSPFTSCFKASRPNHDPTLSTNLTTYVYHTEYGTVSLTWSRSMLGRSLHVNLHDHSSFHLHLKPWRKKGSKRLSHNTVFLWNLSRFGPGPEPRSKFYLAIEVEDSLGLLVGDLIPKSNAKRPSKTHQLLLLKQDHVHVAVAPHGSSRVYQTKANVGGKIREIQIDCKGYEYGYEEESLRLLFRVDGVKVLEVTRLKWKFRGSERVEIDRMHVQISWDVHDWLFDKNNHCNNSNNNDNNGNDEGHAVFMFKFEEDEVRGGCGKEEDGAWSSVEWRNWSSSSLSASSSVGSFGGSSSVMEWSSVEENELLVPLGFSLVVYARRK